MSATIQYKALNVVAFEIRAQGLDPIRVITHDIAPGQGRIIIECFGEAWATYWGGMGDQTLQQFFKDCTTQYLVMNLLPGMISYKPEHRKEKREYLGRIVEAIKAAMPMSQVTDVSVQPQQPTVAVTDSLEIFDERRRPLKIGMRVGGRYAKEPRSMSRRGLILEGYEPGHPEPYITNAGRFPIVQLDHQPDMEQWIADQKSV